MTEPSAPPRRVTVPVVTASKGDDTPLVMVTAYDAPSARIVDAAGVDMILVGDSVAMAVLGYVNSLWLLDTATGKDLCPLPRRAVRGLRQG